MSWSSLSAYAITYIIPKRVAFSCQVNLVVMANSWVGLLDGSPLNPNYLFNGSFLSNFKPILALAHSLPFLGLQPLRSTRSQLKAKQWTIMGLAGGNIVGIPANLLECSKRAALTLGQGLWGWPHLTIAEHYWCFYASSGYLSIASMRGYA